MLLMLIRMLIQVATKSLEKLLEKYCITDLNYFLNDNKNVISLQFQIELVVLKEKDRESKCETHKINKNITEF